MSLVSDEVLNRVVDVALDRRLDQLTKSFEESLDKKLRNLQALLLDEGFGSDGPSLHRSGSSTARSVSPHGSRPNSGHFEEPLGVIGHKEHGGSNRMGVKTLSTTSSATSDDYYVAGGHPDASPSSPGSPTHGGSRSLQSLQSQDNIPPDHSEFDCDPRSWIIAAGRLDKKRDGSWKAGWGKRFFVLSSHTLYYYLVPKRGSKQGEMNSLLGDERGQIRLADIQTIQNKETDEGHLILLECADVKKPGFTQSSNTSIVLRASTRQLAENWGDMLRKAREMLKNSNDPIRVGGGRLLEGYIPSSQFDQFLGMSRSDSGEKVGPAFLRLRERIRGEVLPVVEKCKETVHADARVANHVDPYIALAMLLGINTICYMGPSLNEMSIWMLSNLAFLGFVVYYEKLASEYDTMVFRQNRANKHMKSHLERLAFFLEQEEEEAHEAIEPSVSAFTPISPEKASPTAAGAAAGAGPIIPEPMTPVAAKDVPGKPMAGSTMKWAPEEDEVPCSWDQCDASIFKIRQVGYSKTKMKEKSGDSLYEVVGMDLLKGNTKLENIHTYVNLPPPRECDDLDLIKKSGLPRLFIVNIQLPTRAPSPFGGDDPGTSCVFYFGIKPETATAAAAASEEDIPPAVALFKRFAKEFDKNDDIRRRFKGIGIAANFKDLPLNSRLEGYNGKPVILFKTAVVTRGPDCIEVNVSVHKFNIVARTVFNQFKELASDIKIRAGFLIQGEDDSELPECMLGCGKLNNVDFAESKDISSLK